MSKNNAKGTLRETNLDNGFLLLEFTNKGFEIQHFERDIDNTSIQLHFCLHGNATFLFNNGVYEFNVANQHCILLYNPQQKLPINLEIKPKTTLVTLLISIEKFHLLFSKEAGYIPFLSEENKSRKYYDESIIKPNVLLVLQQIINNVTINNSIRNLYIKGKIYELLSLHFQKDESFSGEYCPFLMNENDVLKIREAKDIIIARMEDPPTLQDLANEIGVNLKKLKEGFKQIYGDTVYSFLFDYKMEYARKLLESNQYNVNEVGILVGYSTASHFISAYKKKFGITPKQYVLSLNPS